MIITYDRQLNTAILLITNERAKRTLIYWTKFSICNCFAWIGTSGSLKRLQKCQLLKRLVKTGVFQSLWIKNCSYKILIQLPLLRTAICRHCVSFYELWQENILMLNRFEQNTARNSKPDVDWSFIVKNVAP